MSTNLNLDEKEKSIRKTAKYLDDTDLLQLAKIEQAEMSEFQTNSNSEVQFYDSLSNQIYSAQSPCYIHKNIPQATPFNSYLSPGYNYLTNMTKTYDYGKSYKILLLNLRGRLSREQYKLVCLHLSKIRPSFIAICAGLSQQDLTFVEHSFNRLSLEYERFMALSGTPAAIWRRTGEIVAVGREFTYLTGWSADQLVGYKYIFDIMEPSSVLKYFETYSEIAFDGEQNTGYLNCKLLGSKNEEVDCTYCFTLKKDVFDLPMVIIGNFLPVFDN
eukprot:NODE_886_length_3442_cov_0.414897.p2 type:complete len:273 gc:universal NODE_886_length_3442_cov_0.414897:994-176(-)